MPWTENEEELLLLCYEQGKSIEDIASVLGRPQNSIMLRLANLGKIKYDLHKVKMQRVLIIMIRICQLLIIMLRTWRGCVLY